MKYIVFLIIFISLFGPKVGLVDFSSLGAMSSILLVLLKRKKSISNEYLNYIVIIAFVFLYSFVLNVLVASDQSYSVLRNLRALLSSVFLGFVFMNFDYDLSDIIDILVAILACNAISILLQIFIPEIQLLFSYIYGFDKSFVKYRAFGLTAGFDTAGYLCSIGAILTYYGVYYSKYRTFHLLIQLLFIVSAVFTSRSSMVLMLLSVAIIISLYFAKDSGQLKCVALFYLLLILVALVTYIVPLFLGTFLNTKELYGGLNKVDSDYVKSFARTDIEEWQYDMYTLPPSFMDIFFGIGRDISTSDVGYVKLIYMVGIVGSLFIYTSYLYTGLVMLKIRGVLRKYKEFNKELLTIANVFIVIILLVFFINIKNLYFFTRTYHELVVILFFSILKKFKSARSSFSCLKH